MFVTMGPVFAHAFTPTGSFTENTGYSGRYSVRRSALGFLLTATIVVSWTGAPEANDWTIGFVPRGWSYASSRSVDSALLGYGYFEDQDQGQPTSTNPGPVFLIHDYGNTASVYYMSADSTFSPVTRTSPLSIGDGDSCRVTPVA